MMTESITTMLMKLAGINCSIKDKIFARWISHPVVCALQVHWRNYHRRQLIKSAYLRWKISLSSSDSEMKKNFTSCRTVDPRLGSSNKLCAFFGLLCYLVTNTQDSTSCFPSSIYWYFKCLFFLKVVQHECRSFTVKKFIVIFQYLNWDYNQERNWLFTWFVSDKREWF